VGERGKWVFALLDRDYLTGGVRSVGWVQLAEPCTIPAHEIHWRRIAPCGVTDMAPQS